MKKSLPLLILATALLFSVSVIAQPSLEIGPAYSMPTGDFGDDLDPGIGAGANVFVGLPTLPFQLGGRIAYNRFTADSDAGDLEESIIEVIPSIRYILGPPLSPVKIFAQFGVGAYMWKSKFEPINKIVSAALDSEDDGVDFGFSIGGGVRAKLGPLVGLTAMPLYNIIMTEDESTSYLSLNVALTF